MKNQYDFTKRDLFIVLACIFFLLLNIAAVGSNGREQAKRMVCIANLNKLTQAWILYADDNDGKLVNGAAGLDTNQYHRNEHPWVDRDWSDNYYYAQLPQEQQQVAIKSGALWPYCRNIRLYHCPSGRPGEFRNYSIVDSMNGLPRQGTYHGYVGSQVDQTVLWIKKMSEIRVPGPEKRAVFIDEGWITPDSYAVHFLTASWWDSPPVRHGEGTNLSFADGHAEPWTWQGKKTIEIGKMTYLYIGMVPESEDDFQDLYRMQKGVWGRLGYVPSH